MEAKTIIHVGISLLLYISKYFLMEIIFTCTMYNSIKIILHSYLSVLYIATGLVLTGPSPSIAYNMLRTSSQDSPPLYTTKLKATYYNIERFWCKKVQAFLLLLSLLIGCYKINNQ